MQVTWSYTYTRPGYSKKHHHSVPKDWWTEDISDLDIDLFRCIITAVRSTYMLPPQLIGEALHVYACRWLPDTTNIRVSPPDQSSDDETLLMEKNRRIVDTIASFGFWSFLAKLFNTIPTTLGIENNISHTIL